MFAYVVFVILMAVFSGVSFTLLDPVMKLLFKEELGENVVQPDLAFNIMSIKNTVYYFVQDVIKAEGKQEALLTFVFIIVGLNFAGNIFRYLATYFEAILRTKTIRALRADVFNKLMGKQLSYIDKQRKGDLITRLTADVDEVERSVVGSMQALFKNPIQIGIFITIMIQYSASLTGFIFLVLPISAVFIGVIGKSLKRNAKDGQKYFSNLLSVIEESISGLRVIKAFRAEAYTAKVFDRFNERFSNLYRKQLFKKALASPFSETTGVIAVGIILWYGGNLIFQGKMEPEGFFAYIVLFTQTLQPAKGLSTAISNIYKGIASAERIFSLMDVEVSIRDKDNAVQLKSFDKTIEFRNVEFAYDDEPVLQNLNLQLEKGKFYALVGPSGCGKSTTAEMLLRFYDPGKGQILLDDLPLSEIGLESLRTQMSIVTQEPILFNDTIFNNVAFGLKNVSQEQVERAAKAANAHDFIVGTPDGYQTMVGDRGTLLSGGQRQRLSIARAILKDAPILILDEATSSLDTESERIVQEALYKLMENRTSLVIAHRLSTIQNADKIFVMEKGTVIEEGSHKELLESKGLYWHLTRLQQIDG